MEKWKGEKLSAIRGETASQPLSEAKAVENESLADSGDSIIGSFERPGRRNWIVLLSRINTDRRDIEDLKSDLCSIGHYQLSIIRFQLLRNRLLPNWADFWKPCRNRGQAGFSELRYREFACKLHLSAFFTSPLFHFSAIQ
ncbi:MAG: hypothetical protein IPN69_05925 [Acidobacteria bacterium]|nr:hypothetical protein [Acidobacteriota bacterium]